MPDTPDRPLPCTDTDPHPPHGALRSNLPGLWCPGVELLLDPDCRDGKHGSCVGDPCGCTCHRCACGARLEPCGECGDDRCPTCDPTGDVHASTRDDQPPAEAPAADPDEYGYWPDTPEEYDRLMEGRDPAQEIRDLQAPAADPEVPRERDGVDYHWGPDPSHGGLCKHVGPRETCPGPDCEDDAADPEAIYETAVILPEIDPAYEDADPEAPAVCHTWQFRAARNALMSALDDTDCPDDDHLICRRCADEVTFRVIDAVMAGVNAVVPSATPSGRSATGRPGYRLVLCFGAADDTQAGRLGMAWAETCAAEFGTRGAVVQRADGTVLAGEITTGDANVIGRSADEIKVAIEGVVKDCFRRHENMQTVVNEIMRDVVGPMQEIIARDRRRSDRAERDAATQRQRAERAESQRREVLTQRDTEAAALDAARTELATRDASIDQAEAERDDAERRARRLSADLDEVSAERDEAREARDGWIKIGVDNKAEVVEQRQRAERAEADRDALCEQNGQLQTDLAVATRTVAELRDQVENRTCERDLEHHGRLAAMTERDRLREADARVRAARKRVADAGGTALHLGELDAALDGTPWPPVDGTDGGA